MRAIVASGPGDVDVLRDTELPDPIAAGSQLLVEVVAAGVCGHDVLCRRGSFPGVGFPRVLGHEVAGVVRAVGAAVRNFDVGDRVVATQNQACGSCDDCRAGHDNRCARGRGILGHACEGVTSEYAVLDEWSAVRLPDQIDAGDGALLACAIGTALRALRRARLAVGETVLVTGASGGVGIHALQLVAQLGGRAMGWTRSDLGQVLYDNGADVALTGDLDPVEVRELTAGRGVDVVLETVGAASFDRSVRCLRPGGRLALVGNVDAAPIELLAGRAILREVEIVAALGCTRQELVEVVDLAASGRVKSRVAERYPFEEVAAAHRAVERGGNVGRVVIDIGTDARPMRGHVATTVNGGNR